jgi:hypothetical protein
MARKRIRNGDPNRQEMVLDGRVVPTRTYGQRHAAAMTDVAPDAGLRVTVLLDGQLVEVPVAELNLVDWKTAQPVRRFGFFTQQRRNPGWLHSDACGGRLIPYESRLELAHLLALDFSPQTTWLTVQPLRIHWRFGGRPRSHVPDVLVMRQGLAPQLINITHERRRDDEAHLARQAKAEQLAERVGWGYRRLVGPPPAQLLANLRTLQSYRGRLGELDFGISDRALELLQEGPATLRELEARLGAGPLTRGALMALIADGRVRVDLLQPLGDATLIERGLPRALEVQA